MAEEASKRSLIDHFSALKDPRQAWKVIYPLPEIMLLVLCATLAGAEDFVEARLWDPGYLENPHPTDSLNFFKRFPCPKGYYACLRVNSVRNADQIRTAYRRCAKQWHPDVDPSPRARARFQAINEAYRTLTTPSQRVAYDQPVGCCA